MKIQKNLRIFVLVLSLIFLIQPIQTMENSSESNSLDTNGSINGVLWAYNEHKDRVSTSSVNLSDSASINKAVTSSKVSNINMNLITGFNEVDSYYNRYINFVMRDGANSSYQLVKGWGPNQLVGNKTGKVDNILTMNTNAFYRYDWAQTYISKFNKSKITGHPFSIDQSNLGLAGGPLIPYSGNIYVGNAFTSTWFTTNVTATTIRNVTIPQVDIFQQQYGQITVPELIITYYFDQFQTPDDLTDDQVTMIENLVPAYQLVSVKTQSFNVNINKTTLTEASIQGTFNLTGQYSQTTTGNEVLISDAQNFIFSWYGLESTVVNYNQSGGFTIQGNLQWIVNNQITFASNGSVVNEDIRLPWWRSSNMSISGLWSHKYSETGTITGKGALQSIIEAIRSRASTSAQDQLLMWANIIPSTMIGYSDTDNSGDLSIRLNGSSLQLLDTIMAVGLTQGVNLKQTYNYANHVNAHSFWQLGNTVLTDKKNDVADQGVKTLNQNWGADPTSSAFYTESVNFNWVTPTVSNGKVVFKWGTMYNNFPTTWSITDGTTEITNQVELMNIGYNYVLTVDPANGVAVLSNTYSNSGFTNTTLKAMASQLSFATYKDDLFLSMQKASDGADSTEGVNQASISTKFGSTDVLDQSFGGTKQTYSLSDGSTYDSQTSVINLITGSGTSGEPDSVNVSTFAPFASSWFGKKVGLSLLKWSADNRTNNPGVDWQYRENLVITSYPTWKGEGVTHDPTYSAVYTPSTPSSNITPSQSTKGASWSLYSSIAALFITISIFKLKSKYKNR